MSEMIRNACGRPRIDEQYCINFKYANLIVNLYHRQSALLYGIMCVHVLCVCVCVRVCVCVCVCMHNNYIVCVCFAYILYIMKSLYTYREIVLFATILHVLYLPPSQTFLCSFKLADVCWRR